MVSPHLDREPRTLAQVRAELRSNRNAAESDLEILKPILERLDVEIAALIDLAPSLNTARARDALGLLADGWHDLSGDTIRAAVMFAEHELDDNTPCVRPGVFA